MKAILNLWTWFNGKKTTIGAAIMLLTMFLSQVIVGKAGYNPAWLDTYIYGLNWVGGILTTGGLMHKMSKPSEQPK